MLRRLSYFAPALLALLLGAPASAQPDLAGSAIINEPNGFPPGCNQPCYSVEKSFEVFLDGNPTGPGVCPAGSNTFLYTLTHLGGAGPFIFPGVTKFEVTATIANVLAAGFIPGAGVSPSATNIGPLDTVGWDFQAPVLATGQTSDQLFICSTSPPGGVTDTMVSTDGQFFLDAPGDCVGPVEPDCTLEIDKTCCLPQPPIPAGDICDGKSIRAVFEVVDGECTDTTNFQDGKAKCSGPNPIVNPVTDNVSVNFRKASDGAEMPISPSSGLAVGDTFEITSVNPTLRNQLKLEVNGPGGTQRVEIHVSCSKALRCNDQFGSLKLVELETTLGGTVNCTVPEVQTETNCTQPAGAVGTPCDSRLVEATFKFSPSDCQSATFQDGKGSCDGDASDANLPVNVTYTGKDPAKISVIPAAGIGDGDTFKVVATGRDELHSDTPLIITDNDSVEQSLEIHTSCSAPLACGDVFGSLTLVAFKTKDGQDVDCDTAPGPIFADACEVPLAPPTPHCTDKLESLTLVYLKDLFGADCSVSNPQEGKASCSGDDLTDDNVSIVVLTDPAKISADPSSNIDEKDLVTFQKLDGGTVKDLPSDLEFVATDGSNNTQTVKIHTSCSKPLNLGDRFGDFAVFAMDRGDGNDADSDSDTDGEDGVISLGGLVEFQYKVTNPNATDVVDVHVDDMPLGPIAADETILAGQMKTFFRTATLFESITNKGTVTGELATGGECPAVSDEVTTTVTLPPAGAFDCSDAKPIDELSMEWAGGQAVCVVAYDGDDPSSDPVLDTVDNVAIGDVVAISGMGGDPNDQVWQIFAAGDCNGTLLGTSEFHISCSDGNMNGVEDCGKNQGDGKDNNASLINDWLLEGISGDTTLDCTPIVIPSGGGGGSCGIGFELAFLLAPMMWLFGRRRRS